MMSRNKIFAFIITVIVAVFVVTLPSAIEDADKSKNYVCQVPITGEYVVWTDGGLQWQGYGNVKEYAKTSQIEFTDLERNEGGYVAVGENPAAGTTFNDRGKGYIIGSFRVVLPNDEQHMMAIQRDFGSEKALISTLVRPTLYKVVTACGPLMSSLESVSETRTDLTAYITDQLNNGVYKTKTTKVEVANEITGEMETRTQAELIADPNAPGGYKRQETSPFSQYGITAGIVSVLDIKYDAATQQQIDAQKAANLAVITAKTQAAKAIQETITIEEQGKARAAEAKWEQEREKAVAVTRAEQEREVSRLAAEKAEFDKKKIVAQGQAEAEANRLKVQAGLTPQERAEWDYKTAVGVAEALANSKVSWVPSVMMGSNGSNGTAMDAVGLNMLMEVVNKMNTK